MTTRTSLHNRLEKKARPAVQFSRIQETDKQGRAKVVVTPGSEGKKYQVILRRVVENEVPTIYTECHCITGNGLIGCKGNNGSGEICYHSASAILKSVDGKNMKISFCASEQDAKNLVHMGGLVIRIRSYQGNGELWAVAK